MSHRNAFMENFSNNDEEFNQIFHKRKQLKTQIIHGNDQKETTISKLKKKTKKESKLEGVYR